MCWGSLEAAWTCLLAVSPDRGWLSLSWNMHGFARQRQRERILCSMLPTSFLMTSNAMTLTICSQGHAQRGQGRGQGRDRVARQARLQGIKPQGESRVTQDVGLGTDGAKSHSSCSQRLLRITQELDLP